jgi:hypothetical protein
MRGKADLGLVRQLRSGKHFGLRGPQQQSVRWVKFGFPQGIE